MKKSWAVFLAVALALGAVAILQWRALQQQRAHAEAVERALQEEVRARGDAATRATEAETRAERLQREVQEFSTVTSNLRSNQTAQDSNLTALAERLKPALGTNGANGKEGLFGKGMGDMLAKMMEDPAMRKMVRAQQKAMIDMMYGGLFKDLQLGPEEKTALTEILLDAQMQQVDNVRGMFGGTEGDAAGAGEAMKQAKQETEAQIKELLGDDRFAEYEDYQKNVGERMQLSQLQTRLETANLPLQNSQTAQLMQLMQEERSRVPPVIPSGPDANPADLKAMMTPEKLEQQMAWSDDYNRRVLERAATVLSPEQLRLYREFQEQQAAMQKLGLKMASEMFGKAAEGGTGTPATK